MATAYEILLVLNNLKEVDLADLKFGVITSTGQDENHHWWPFELGEVMVLGPNGREYFGDGRKPSKYDVEYEVFETLAQAMACRNRVLREK